ncbi:hypothetical protein [Desulfofundulus thermosubterraneus]|uniref:hypothetical protein n=1 Tax=Desulfofundulus thermosubterraneus TaxID=348840 RepID=UPI001A958DA5|nr:hypothetical protein [Desulfofundulus thermosubterraneus]
MQGAGRTATTVPAPPGTGTRGHGHGHNRLRARALRGRGGLAARRGANCAGPGNGVGGPRVTAPGRVFRVKGGYR